MGYGVPAAIAAKIAAPERCVIAFAGDGDFLMTGQELATAVQYGAGVLILLFNNSMYGTIRMHQEREFPAREHGTRLVNPDFRAASRNPSVRTAPVLPRLTNSEAHWPPHWPDSRSTHARADRTRAGPRDSDAECDAVGDPCDRAAESEMSSGKSGRGGIRPAADAELRVDMNLR